MRLGRHRDASNEAGFTLVELVIVVLIIGVIMVMMTPTFLGASQRAADRAAQTSLRVASTSAWVYVVKHDTFASHADAIDELNDIEPSLDFVDGDTVSTDPHTVSVAEDADGKELALAVLAADDTCFYLRTSLITQESRYADDSVEACRASDYRDGPNSGW